VKKTWVLLFAAILNFSYVETSQAWARRGHAMIATAAGYVLSGENSMLKEKSIDLEYYANVPDIIWKNDDKILAAEKPEHFMDLEIFERETKTKNIPFKPTRQEFFAKYPQIPLSAGRSYWRIKEINDQFTSVAEALRNGNHSDLKGYQEMQGKWLMTAGILGHYVGDLSMPLHVSENYDGKLTKQDGIHKFFEEDLVDELYPQIAGEVIRRTEAQWATFHKNHQKLSIFELAVQLGKDSSVKKDELLDIDKAKGRKLKNVAPIYKALVLERLTQGSLYLAEVWSRQLGWKYEGAKFYNFDAKPAYMEPLAEPQTETKTADGK
jgi:hypothetical protein